jgi:hypothetical protein
VASPELGDMDLDEMDVPPWLRVFLMKRREHWVRSVYLLIEVHEEEADDGRCGASASQLPGACRVYPPHTPPRQRCPRRNASTGDRRRRARGTG